MKTCLIVDDSKVVRMVARKILEGLNFEIAEAEDGQQALDACMAEMPAAVLLDWNMPVKNGLEFLQELRALDGVEQPVVVFCTTENDMTHIQEAIEAGANEYIMKPFDSEIIESKFIPCLSGLHPHPLGLEWARTGYRGARHGCSRPRRSPIPAFATRVPATFPR